MASLSMSRAEREAFLAGTHVGVVSIAQAGRGPLAVPVWYRYEPGGVVRFGTGARSRKAALLRKAGRAGFCVQTETAPYQYVSIEGPVQFGAVDFERDTKEMAVRYLGRQMGEMYLATLSADPEESILVTLKPERWYSVDYGKMG